MGNTSEMPECQNCGAFVSKQFVRVMVPEDLDAPRVCPECPDIMRDGSEIREKKA